MFADGSNGSVELLNDSIIIRRKGLANILTQGVQGDKQVLIKNITAVQFRSAGSMMAGLIQFSILGGRDYRGGMLEATKDENAVMFTREQEPSFLMLRDAIQNSLKRPDNPTGGALAEELERLAALHETGHLTTEEFTDAKKRFLTSPPSFATSAPPETQPYANASVANEKKGGCLKGVLISLAVVFVLLTLIGVTNSGPRWGELGYKPHISDECRAVWASANVDAARYVATVCTPDERHEIAGYRPN